MNLIGTGWSELIGPLFKKLLYLTMFTLHHLQI